MSDSALRPAMLLLVPQLASPAGLREGLMALLSQRNSCWFGCNEPDTHGEWRLGCALQRFASMNNAVDGTAFRGGLARGGSPKSSPAHLARRQREGCRAAADRHTLKAMATDLYDTVNELRVTSRMHETKPVT